MGSCQKLSSEVAASQSKEYTTSHQLFFDVNSLLAGPSFCTVMNRKVDDDVYIVLAHHRCQQHLANVKEKQQKQDIEKLWELAAWNFPYEWYPAEL
jgi:uncharacterized protein YgiM (DUF1202 family)